MTNKISIIPYRFYIEEEDCLIDNVSLLNSSVSESKEIFSKDFFQQLIYAMPSTDDCLKGTKMKAVGGKLVSLNDSHTIDDDKYFILYLELKVSSTQENFDQTSIIDTYTKTVKSNLKKNENIGDNNYIGVIVEKEFRKIDGAKRLHGFVFVSKKGNGSIRSIADDMIKQTFNLDNAPYLSEIIDQNNMVVLNQSLKRIVIGGYMNAGALTNVGGLKDGEGDYEIVINIKPLNEKSALSKLLGNERKKFKKHKLLKIKGLDVKKIQGIIVDSSGNQHTEDLEGEDGTIEYVKKALSYKLNLTKDKFTLGGFIERVSAFISFYRNTNDI